MNPVERARSLHCHMLHNVTSVFSLLSSDSVHYASIRSYLTVMNTFLLLRSHDHVRGMVNYCLEKASSIDIWYSRTICVLNNRISPLVSFDIINFSLISANLKFVIVGKNIDCKIT